MQANFILTQCVNLCLQDCTQDTSFMQTCKYSSPVRTNLEVSKTWSWIFNERDRTAELKPFTQQELGRRLTVSMPMGSVLIATQCLKQWDVFITVFVKRHDLPQLKKTFNVEQKEGTGWSAETAYREERLHCCRNVGKWMVESLDDWCALEHLRESFPYKRPLRQDQLLDKIKSGALFGYVRCDIKVPDHLREKFVNFPPIFKNTNVCRQYIGPLMQEYAEKKGLVSQQRRRWNSSFELINGTITTSLPFYLELGLVYTKNYRFVEYTPVKCFNNFVQSAVNARRHWYENPNSSVVAETMKLLANS